MDISAPSRLVSFSVANDGFLGVFPDLPLLAVRLQVVSEGKYWRVGSLAMGCW